MALQTILAQAGIEIWELEAGLSDDEIKRLAAAFEVTAPSLPPAVTEIEMQELAAFVDHFRCHFDQREKVHYVGLFKKVDVAPRVVLTALRVLRHAVRSRLAPLGSS